MIPKTVRVRIRVRARVRACVEVGATERELAFMEGG